MDFQLSFSEFAGGASSSSRGEWRELMGCLDALGPDELSNRWETSRRMIREQGVTCHVPNGEQPGNRDRLWELDILPAVIGAESWRELEAGLIQRARLLNVLLGDLYGLQHCLRNGWLPAPLVYANPHFLRPCQGVRIAGCHMPFYAVDLAQSHDGRWWVLADRAQAPAGIGFALKNRAVVSRVLPEAMREIQPRPLNDMFPLIGETLANLANERKENPTVVVMTPGPRNEAFFEHAFLARTLGFTLVEGGDLAVRGRRVFLKTLEGLRPVDVILRRVNDAFCDPLELRDDSMLGVPGLLEAARSGSVAIANALGCGIVETPALMAFLPNLCRQMLGEELAIPSVATWWCGGLVENRHVAENLGRLALRSAFSPPGLVEPTGMRQALVERFHSNPQEVIAQEEIILSQIPALKNGGFAAAPYLVRAFVICNNGVCRVMPGGLVRMPNRGRIAAAPAAIMGGSKDLWVLSDAAKPAERDHPVTVAPALFVERSPIDLPSRSADNLFWLGRYTERLESLLRISRSAVNAFSEDFGSDGVKRLVAVCSLLARLELIPSHESDAGGDCRDAVSRDLIALLSDPELDGGARDLRKRIHQSAFAVRDRLSSDTWRLISQIEADSPAEPCSLSMLHASAMLDALVLDLAAFSGMEMENMTRGHGWMFLDFGRRLERSRNLLALLAAFLASGDRMDLLMEPVLDMCDSVITYRQRHFAEMHMQGVLGLLLFEPNNPRSLAFQFAAMKRGADSFPEAPNPEGVARLRERIAGFEGRLWELEAVTGAGAAALELETMSAHLSNLSHQLSEVSDLVTLVYFSHSIPRVA